MTIEQRMELLERTNRRWRRLACTMAVLIVAAVGIGAAQMNEDELVLRKLVIQDEEGRERIVLDTNRHGAGMTYYDANGKGRIESGTKVTGDAWTTHFDANGKKRIVSATYPSGNASIYHSDANGNTRIVSATLADGHASTFWSEYDANGKIQVVKKLP